MPIAPDRSRRRDAVRSREAILVAAERLLAERGEGVPLSEVGKAARVGQATLYRHFPDRHALLAAVLRTRIGEFEEVARQHADAPDGIVVLLRWMAAEQASSTAILELIRLSGPASEAVTDLVGAVRGAVATPIAAAVRAGRVRPDFTADDFLLVLGMTQGVLHAGMGVEQRARAAGRVLDLVLTGLLRLRT